MQSFPQSTLGVLQNVNSAALLWHCLRRQPGSGDSIYRRLCRQQNRLLDDHGANASCTERLHTNMNHNTCSALLKPGPKRILRQLASGESHEVEHQQHSAHCDKTMPVGGPFTSLLQCRFIAERGSRTAVLLPSRNSINWCRHDGVPIRKVRSHHPTPRRASPTTYSNS